LETLKLTADGGEAPASPPTSYARDDRLVFPALDGSASLISLFIGATVELSVEAKRYLNIT
jgi:hypothetical protein